MAKFFVTPFALAGNKTTVPESVQPDGSISYTEGWGPDYELANTEPDYKPISREQTNQMFNDVTAALSEVQYNGVALWSADGSGNYPINAIVRHNDLLWLSNEDDNATEPGAVGATWSETSSMKRTLLTSDVTIYVNESTGDDANDGLTAGSPKATPQAAYDLLADSYDLAGYTATIQLADGSYTTPLVVVRPVPGGGLGTVVIQGNSSNPTAVDMTVSAGQCIGSQSPGCRITPQYMVLNGPYCLIASNYGTINLGPGVTFGASSQAHIYSQFGGGIILGSSYSVTSGASFHLQSLHGFIQATSGITATLTGTPAFTQTVRSTDGGQVALSGITFVGTATGVRYSASTNGVINTGGGGANFIPGSIAGATTTGGQYV